MNQRLFRILVLSAVVLVGIAMAVWGVILRQTSANPAKSPLAANKTQTENEQAKPVSEQNTGTQPDNLQQQTQKSSTGSEVKTTLTQPNQNKEGSEPESQSGDENEDTESENEDGNESERDEEELSQQNEDKSNEKAENEDNKPTRSSGNYPTLDETKPLAPAEDTLVNENTNESNQPAPQPTSDTPRATEPPATANESKVDNPTNEPPKDAQQKQKKGGRWADFTTGDKPADYKAPTYTVCSDLTKASKLLNSGKTVKVAQHSESISLDSPKEDLEKMGFTFVEEKAAASEHLPASGSLASMEIPLGLPKTPVQKVVQTAPAQVLVPPAVMQPTEIEIQLNQNTKSSDNGSKLNVTGFFDGGTSTVEIIPKKKKPVVVVENDPLVQEGIEMIPLSTHSPRPASPTENSTPNVPAKKPGFGKLINAFKAAQKLNNPASTENTATDVQGPNDVLEDHKLRL